ncbi:flagellar filament capping protein FliD [Paenibacillus sp. UMB4589-SE434]|uniref:flagellar filament capping protein FliD n=1 Tax=Paenibacillus sp. UMB4589-SE434 TaxID=3046314 RepID=UPI00254F6D83|nr:flagellar filament capping protein FliD [Paenibacillus sp. UMB4589-SE434]MDK8181636.1 flagellar filament capping protein FliD [Paenibacillus sp. UMB4589-SE434]
MAGVNGPMRLSGFSGQLDTTNIIKDLMKAESIPLDKITRKKQFLMWQREDYRSMNTALISFRNAINDLRFESNFETTKATSSNSGILEVASSGSNAGMSSVKITQLANSASIIGGKVSAKPSDLVSADGTVSITGSKGTADIKITSGASTMDSIIKDINANSGQTGVKASFDTSSGVLYLSSSVTGAQSKVDIGPLANNALANVFNLTTVSATGQDAKYSVNAKYDTNGQLVSGAELTASSNTVNINGVQVNLRNIGEATIGVNSDRGGTIDKIKNFVNQYNDLIDKFSSASTTRRNRDYQPLTTEERSAMSEREVEAWEKKARVGTLYNESLLTGTLGSLRSAINTSLDVGQDELRLLAQIGITAKSSYKENGKLQIDEKKLQDALNNRFDEVKQLFIKSSNTPADTPENIKKRRAEIGIADRLYEEINNKVNDFTKKIGSGSLEAQDSSVLGSQLRDLNKEEKRMKSRLVDIENRYYKRFTAMEKALQKLNSQGSWLASQLGG